MCCVHVTALELVVVEAFFVEVRVQTCLQGQRTVSWDLKIEDKEWLIRDRYRTLALNIYFILLNTTKDVSDETRLKYLVSVLLARRCLESSRV